MIEPTWWADKKSNTMFANVNSIWITDTRKKRKSFFLSKPLSYYTQSKWRKQQLSLDTALQKLFSIEHSFLTYQNQKKNDSSIDSANVWNEKKSRQSLSFTSYHTANVHTIESFVSSDEKKISFLYSQHIRKWNHDKSQQRTSIENTMTTCSSTMRTHWNSEAD